MAVIAVTGATGFIGRHLVASTIARQHQVRTLIRPHEGRDHNSAENAFTGDVTDRESLQQFLTGVEIVIHLAGVAHTSLDRDADRQRAFEVNVSGTKAVLEVAREQGVRRVVIASSAHVYAGQKGVEVKEEAPQQGENFYAETKIEVERVGREFDGIEVVFGRPCLTYGPNAGFNLLKLMQAIQRGRYFHIGSKKVLRSFGSVYTVAKAFLHLAEHGRRGEAYNIADRRPMLLEEFTNELSHEIGVPEPKRLPYTIAWSAAAGFSLARNFGVSGPITLDSLRKLTESFSVSTGKLAATGFQWQDEDLQKARRDMVNAFLEGTH